jgi:Zn-dependent peptidase ImmA (M78 family)
MAPSRVEPREVPPQKGNRVEKLADNFAGALLMPADVVERRWQARGESDLHDWLMTTSSSLHVTAVALKWRLVVLGHLTKGAAEEIDDRALAANGDSSRESKPLPFDHELIARIRAAVEAGHLSLARATRILGITPRAFGELCTAYGLTLSYEV